MGQREFDALREEVRKLRAAVRMRPITTIRGGGVPTLYIIRMGGGNEIATYGSTTYYGLQYPTSDITSIPTAVPSTTDGAITDQLSPGYLQNADGSSETLVWVGTRLKPGSAAAITGMLSVIPKGTTVLAFQTVSMQILASGVFAPVYVPERVT